MFSKIQKQCKPCKTKYKKHQKHNKKSNNNPKTVDRRGKKCFNYTYNKSQQHRNKSIDISTKETTQHKAQPTQPKHVR